MESKLLAKLCLIIGIGAVGVFMLMGTPKPKSVIAQTSDDYTSTWTIEKWMNANMRYGDNCGNCYRGTDRVQRSVQGDRWTQGQNNRPFTLGPAIWKVVMTLDNGATNVCEKWRMTRFRSSSDTDTQNVYGEPYAFPNDDTDRVVVDGRNDGTAVIVYGDETDRGTNNYIPDRWRIERSGVFGIRNYLGGGNYVGQDGMYGLTIMESAGWHASNTVDTDVDEQLTIYPTEWKVTGRIGASNC